MEAQIRRKQTPIIITTTLTNIITTAEFANIMQPHTQSRFDIKMLNTVRFKKQTKNI